VVQRYVLDAIASDDLRVYTVWGPMLGDEKEPDARRATVSLPDPRVSHFWTDAHGVAEAFQAPLALANDRAWDTFLLYPPGARWAEAAPAPTYYMHVGKPLPKERRLNGQKLADQVRATLGGAG
jgi:hypothetical protein